MEDVVDAPKRRLLARFLVGAAVVYAGIAIYFLVAGLPVPAMGNGLTAGIALLVARMAAGREQGGPSLLLACTFIAALVGVNVIIWTTVF